MVVTLAEGEAGRQHSVPQGWAVAPGPAGLPAYLSRPA